MFTLGAGKTLAASGPTAVNFFVFGDAVTTTDAFDILAKGSVSVAATVIYTATAVQGLVKTLVLFNTAGTPSTIFLYANGTATTDRFFTATIPAGGTLTHGQAGWQLTDSSGATIVASAPLTATGDATGTQVGSNIALTLATVTTAQTVGDASHVAVVTTDVKGRVTTMTATAITIASAAVTGLTFFATLANLTGDVTTSGTGATTLATFGPGAVGPIGDASHVAAVSTDAKGRVSTLSSVAISIANTAVTGLGTLSTQNGTFSGTHSGSSSGTNTGDQTLASLGAASSARLINTTSPLTGGGDLTADRTIAIPAATPTVPGYMTAAFANTVTDLWYDVTNYGVSISNSGAANVAAMNTLIQTTAPGSARFFFPATGANYPMVGTITVTQNYQRFIGAGQINSVLFVGNTTQNLFQINDGVAGVEFHDLGFWTTAAASAGAVFNVGTPSGIGCQQTSFYNLGFNPFGGNFFDLILFNGSRGGEVSFVDGCVMNAFTSRGVAVIGNTSIPTSTAELVISNTIMNGQITGSTGAVAGIYVQQCGAVNVTDCSIILCNNNLLVSPLVSVSQIVASILIENTFFDSAFGDSAKFGGVGAIVRCKFSNCYFTLAAAAPNGSASFSFLNTAANAPAGIDFVNCSFLNTFSNANTTFGVLMTNVADVQHINSKVSGWTTGISVTPATPAGSTRVQIIGGTVGPAGGIKGNGTGILLNTGATTYGLVELIGVSFPLASAFGVANTVNLTDSSVLLVGASKIISLNTGLATGRPATTTTTTIPLTTVTNADTNGGLPIPANCRPGTKVRATVVCTSAATIQTTTATLRFGTANSNADPALATLALAAGTAVVGGGRFVFEFDLLTTVAAVGLITWDNAVNSAVATPVATGMSATPHSTAGSTAPVAVATSAQTFMGVYLSSATASAVTVRSVSWEIISQ